MALIIMALIPPGGMADCPALHGVIAMAAAESTLAALAGRAPALEMPRAQPYVVAVHVVVEAFNDLQLHVGD